jgi:hypothetical protein
MALVRGTGGILPGIQEPGHGGPPWHNVRATNPLPFSFMAGSAGHEAGRSKTPAPVPSSRARIPMRREAAPRLPPDQVSLLQQLSQLRGASFDALYVSSVKETLGQLQTLFREFGEGAAMPA